MAKIFHGANLVVPVHKIMLGREKSLKQMPASRDFAMPIVEAPSD